LFYEEKGQITIPSLIIVQEKLQKQKSLGHIE